MWSVGQRAASGVPGCGMGLSLVGGVIVRRDASSSGSGLLDGSLEIELAVLEMVFEMSAAARWVVVGSIAEGAIAE